MKDDIKDKEERNYKGCFILITVTFVSIVLCYLGYTNGIFYNQGGYRIDMTKVVGAVILVLAMEGYIAWKIYGQKQKLVKAS